MIKIITYLCICSSTLCLAMQTNKDPLKVLKDEVSSDAHTIEEKLRQLHPQITPEVEQKDEASAMPPGTTVIREDVQSTGETFKNAKPVFTPGKKRKRTVFSIYNIPQEQPAQQSEEQPTASSGNQAKNEKETTTQVPPQETSSLPKETLHKQKKQLQWLSKRWVHVGVGIGVLTLIGYLYYKKSASHTPSVQK